MAHPVGVGYLPRAPMDFGKTGWLQALLDEAVSSHDPAGIPVRAGGPVGDRPGTGRARRYVRQVLRQSGLLYGTPTDEHRDASAPPEVALFLAVMRTFATIALDLAELVGAPRGPRREQVLVIYAALLGKIDEAEQISAKLPNLGPSGLPAKLWSRVEDALEQRAVSLGGDPAYGLVLHNGAVYADAQLFARHAADFFVHGKLRRKAILRRNEVSARRKALLVEVLTALNRVERVPSFPVRRAILRQLEDLHLPPALEEDVRSRLKRLFEHPAALPTLVAQVRSVDVRRFLLEQTLLASVVDGRRSPDEQEFIRALARALKFSDAERDRIELEVAEFYAHHRNVVDVFTVGPGAQVLGEEALESMTRAVEKNFKALMQEIRETGDLSILVTRAARGQKLTDTEKQRMRDQLLDIAKAIPALAIFAAPGGVLLMIALAKVLPFNILPSAFQDSGVREPTLRDLRKKKVT